MSRLILVPQYPAKLRYQEWWWFTFPELLRDWFEEVVVLGKYQAGPLMRMYDSEYGKEHFSPMAAAIKFEQLQIEQFLEMELREDDVLLLNDLSFPGFFTNALFHKKPKRCYAICHATAKNHYDYFLDVRKSKYGVEKSSAKLFDKIFVASNYHKEKLGWPNIEVTPLPEPPWRGTKHQLKWGIVTVSRPTVQKRTLRIESLVEKMTGLKIEEMKAKSYTDYFDKLSCYKIMLITSKEETFGYQVVDAIKCGVIPIAPNKFSYPELLTRGYLYDDDLELIQAIDNAFDGILTPIDELKTSDASFSFYNTIGKIMSL